MELKWDLFKEYIMAIKQFSINQISSEADRKKLLDAIQDKAKVGGCLIIVDKICDHSGYFSTVMKRLTWHWKIQQGAEAEDIINKEMSLAGVQIPMDNYFLDDAKEFFRMGEFAGWVIEY